MGTFSSTNIVKKNISTKPYLLTVEELNTIGRNINLVGYDPLRTSATGDEYITLKYDNTSSPRLLNYVEEYVIAGYSKTLFYSEVNTGLKLNDKVFIINGVYDSNLLIKNDKYKKGSDGYTVLLVDKCRIVLDIDFTGYLPANEDTKDMNEDLDKFIKVYYVKDKNDFIHVNRQITTRDGNFDYKFNKYQNNIIFTENKGNVLTTTTTGWGQNAGLIGSGFFVKDGTNNWIDITTEFMSGSFSVALSPTYDNSDGKVLILNGTFTQGTQEFKEDSVYKWNDILTIWEVNIKHENNNPPIITKSNFRAGQFNGVWNGGLFGSNEKRIEWNSDTSTFNSGTLLNTVWKKGIINSIYSQLESYMSESGSDNKPYEKITNPDNNGYGFNFIINSDIQNSVINNGNLTNTTLGTQSGNYQIVEEHLKGNLDSTTIGSNFNNIINKALFDNCRFIDANIENSEIRNSRATNTRFNNIKSVNSHYKSSLIINSNYISDNIIKILNYDEFEIYDNDLNNSITVYKFYINKRSYEKFKFKDTFYLKGIKVNDNSKDIINFFDKKFRIGSWTQYSDILSSTSSTFYKRGVEYSAFSSTPKENEYTYSLGTGTMSNTNTINDINTKGYSIDIFVNTKDIHTNPTNESSLKGIIDFSGAFIIDSDFESGVFENSNWNSGHHFNYSNDVNITIPSDTGGLYNIGLTGPNSSSYNLGLTGTSLMVQLPYDTYKREIEEDYLSENSIVFLNDVDYDTSGRVFDIFISGSGSYYRTGTYSTLGNVGKGLILGITASVFGSVTGITYSSPQGTGYLSGTASTTGGSGTGLTVSITTIGDTVDNIFIVNGGMSYSVNDIISVIGGATIATFSITTRNKGEILYKPTIIEQGAGYIKDAGILTIDDQSGYGSFISIMAVTGSITRLPSAYKIETNYNNGLLKLNDISLTTTNLSPGGRFITIGANNRYGYLHKAKFVKSKIKSGFFRNSFIESSLIKNDSYDVSDKDFSNLEKIKSIVICDTLFSGNYNILSKALYLNSYFVLGGDIWDNGILYNSIWNSMTFTNGLVKESSWLNGTFNSGLFYNSNTFNASNSSNYNDNLINSYYKSGTLPNNRYSWRNGTFLNGEFYKSDWENGEFNGGKFYYSKFYNGIVNNGIIGDSSIPLKETIVYNATINYTTVENSKIYSSPYGLSSSCKIHWKDGIFNSGVFGTEDLNTATWSGGIFNNGEFINNAKWENGVFNGGKFLSTYKSNTVDYSIISNRLFSWDNGVFNGGVFGNATTVTNSTWKYGEFNGGRFQGRVWEGGIFSAGEFIGSATFSAIGGLSASNASDFTDSFNSSYYGLWRNGIVTNVKDNLYGNKKRATDIKKYNNKAILKDLLWEDGTFNHTNGEMQNSVWLNGTFKNGLFTTSSFNPYVKRNSLEKLFNFDDTCLWENGNFDGGDFYISNWNNGNFINGNAYGMIWNNGVTSYMNAYNIFWNDGVWKNGNWNGSYFDINNNGGTTDGFTQQILSRGNTASLHTWNIFNRESISLNTNYDTGKGLLISSTPSNVPVTPLLFATQYIDTLGVSRIVVNWSEAYSYYGINRYEILYKIPLSNTWLNAYSESSTLTYGTFTQYTNLNNESIDFKIRVIDNNNNYSAYSPVTTVQIFIMLKLTTNPVVDYSSYIQDVQYVCLLSGSTQNVYTEFGFNTGSTIYNNFNAGVVSSPFVGDLTSYRIMENINTPGKYVVAIDASGIILDDITSPYNTESLYTCGTPVTYYAHNMSISGQSTTPLACQVGVNFSTLTYSASQGLRYTNWLETSPKFPLYTVNAGTTIVFYTRMHAGGSISFDNTYTKTITLQNSYPSVKDWFNTEIAILTDWNAFVAQNYSGALFSVDGLSFLVRPNRNGTATRNIYTDVSFKITPSSSSLILYSTDSTLTTGSILYQDQYATEFDGGDKYWYSTGRSYKINNIGNVSTINNC